MLVTVKSFANIKDVLGTAEISTELPAGATLTDLMAALSAKFGPAFDRQVRDGSTGCLVPFLILINDLTCRSTTDMAMELHESDVVTLMIPFDGG